MMVLGGAQPPREIALRSRLLLLLLRRAYIFMSAPATTPATAPAASDTTSVPVIATVVEPAPAAPPAAAPPAAAAGAPLPAPPSAEPPKPEPWSAEGLPQHHLPAHFTSLDALNTYKTSAGVKTALNLLPVTGGRAADVIKVMSLRAEKNLTDIAKNLKTKDAGMLTLLGEISSKKKQEGVVRAGEQRSKGKVDLESDLSALYARHQLEYASRCQRRTARASAAAEQEQQQPDPGVPHVYAVAEPRERPYPLSHQLAMEVWTEAKHGELAPGLPLPVVGEAPCDELISKTALLSTLAVRPCGATPWVQDHESIEQLTPIAVDLEVSLHESRRLIPPLISQHSSPLNPQCPSDCAPCLTVHCAGPDRAAEARL